MGPPSPRLRRIKRIKRINKTNLRPGFIFVRDIATLSLYLGRTCFGTSLQIKRSMRFNLEQGPDESRSKPIESVQQLYLIY